MTKLNLTDVDISLMDSVTRCMEDEIFNIDNVCTILTDSIMDNLNPYWDGMAKKTFDADFMRFCNKLKRNRASYRNLCDKLIVAKNAYKNADNSVNEKIEDLKICL